MVRYKLSGRAIVLVGSTKYTIGRHIIGRHLGGR